MCTLKKFENCLTIYLEVLSRYFLLTISNALRKKGPVGFPDGMDGTYFILLHKVLCTPIKYFVRISEYDNRKKRNKPIFKDSEGRFKIGTQIEQWLVRTRGGGTTDHFIKTPDIFVVCF